MERSHMFSHVDICMRFLSVFMLYFHSVCCKPPTCIFTNRVYYILNYIVNDGIQT